MATRQLLDSAACRADPFVRTRGHHPHRVKRSPTLFGSHALRPRREGIIDALVASTLRCDRRPLAGTNAEQGLKARAPRIRYPEPPDVLGAPSSVSSATGVGIDVYPRCRCPAPSSRGSPGVKVRPADSRQYGTNLCRRRDARKGGTDVDGCRCSTRVGRGRSDRREHGDGLRTSALRRRRNPRSSTRASGSSSDKRGHPGEDMARSYRICGAQRRAHRPELSGHLPAKPTSGSSRARSARRALSARSRRARFVSEVRLTHAGIAVDVRRIGGDPYRFRLHRHTREVPSATNDSSCSSGNRRPAGSAPRLVS